MAFVIFDRDRSSNLSQREYLATERMEKCFFVFLFFFLFCVCVLCLAVPVGWPAMIYFFKLSLVLLGSAMFDNIDN